jgi:hypothetical protein
VGRKKGDVRVMIVETRKTATGKEYWDNIKKKVLFVPAGKEPNFEVTANPKSMLLGVDLANGPEVTIVNGEVLNDEDVINFSKMTISQLKMFAKENEIEIPEDIKKKDDIITFLTNEE